nr:IS110 family transposase [Mycobacterium lepraemurium]
MLLSLPGCAELTAAKLGGEAAGVTRFKSEAAFARHAGVAPIPVWSGNTAGRVRRTRASNRQLQRRPAPHRCHPDPSQRPRTGLLPPPHRYRRLQNRSPTLPQTPPIPHRLPPPTHRPPKQNSALPNGSGST